MSHHPPERCTPTESHYTFARRTAVESVLVEGKQYGVMYGLVYPTKYGTICGTNYLSVCPHVSLSKSAWLLQ